MKLGLDQLLDSHCHLLEGKRIGLLGHQASLNSQGEHALELLQDSEAWKLTTLFGPEHGFDTKAEDMIAVQSSSHKKSGLVVHSLYGHVENSLKPTPEMFENIDALVIDLQDIGSRYYTYSWTAALCMQTAAVTGKTVIICDRPNPINGVTVEGDIIQEGYNSFVGLYSVPVRHGMTIGGLCHFINDIHEINCKLEIVPMEGWEREWYWDQTGLKWTNPSPNMRSLNAAILYPGMCLLEGTNVSEGRGTEIPFEWFGAPWIEPAELIELLREQKLEGIDFEPATFTPTMHKWAGQKCKGVRLCITDRNKLKPYCTGIAILWSLHALYAEKGFAWRKDAYEFVVDTPAIDLLTGGSQVREGIVRQVPLSELMEWVDEPPTTFLRQRRPYLIY